MFKPGHQGQEDARIGKVDELMQGALTTMMIMQRAAPADMPRYRKKLRDQLQDVVNLAMAFADAYSQG